MSYNFDAYKKGAKDTSGRTIEEIIDHVENRYILYFAEGDYIDAQFHEGEDSGITFSPEFEQLLADIDALNFENKKENSFIRQRIADAVVKEIRGYDEIACSILKKIANPPKSISIKKDSLNFLTSAGLCTGLLTIFTLLAYFDKLPLVTLSKDGSISFKFNNLESLLKNGLYCVEFSALGSLLYHLRNIYKNVDLTTVYPIRQGFIAFIQSSLSGILIYTIILSDLMLGAFKDNVAAMVVISFVSGFNEDIPLQLIAKISKTIK
ncbi:hypothetical protein SAMN02745945_01740 [Peptoclostridium litorale DSM 5388]|uniref:Uncharacterized protein n=1 Tax=Peptoclostridium litorale DSM 5388 TaxID=1121324 RepID=A0A069RGR9_PEPLI|nr:hypothetical protein [Peptoclostridium litorale]KDR95988.1 hypothetical protein CLIT_8c01570 [Peptoclostridium litorale DSM 5388]SIO08605.1 hypothetical protein SAMN02745945_01740 [Peptoclostridium litorale DSM 5388]